MNTDSRRVRMKAMLLACAFGLGSASAGMAGAQEAVKRVVDGEKILDLLVAKGVINRAEADGIVAQATVVPIAPAAEPAVIAGGVQGDVQTIPYIPDTVRDQIKAQIVAEMVAKGQTEGWAKPGEVAEWTKRIKITGDIRVRGEGVFFPNSRLGAVDPLTGNAAVLGGNDPSIVNFGGINGGSPFNTNRTQGTPNPPYLNTTEDRNRARIRARIGIEAKLTDWSSANVRIATGNDTSPVSTNQTLGGGNGDFSKYSIWLDRANIQFTPHGALEGTKLVAGRAENPYWTTELIFDDDLNFDGVSLAGKRPLASRLAIFGTAGAFPTYNTDFNFGSRNVSAFKSRDRWLLAAQGGFEFKPTDQAKLTAGVGYFHFTNAQGKVSSPCLFSQDVCDTDNTRPLFQQYGNSVFPIRKITPDNSPTIPVGSSPEAQYFGLVSNFHVLEAHAAVDLTYFAGMPIRIEGEFLKNLAFDRARTIALQSNVSGPYKPSGSGWSANVTVGTPKPGKWGEWTAFGGYKRIGSDATIDAFTDSDFHLGGTNAQGYVVGAGFGLGGGVSLGARWISTDEITGQPYSVDLLQVDLSARF